MPRAMRHATTGFTLIELLVVISIISLLMAIMLPVLGKARSVARRMVCASQTKQIVLGQLMYTDDYKGWFPPTDSKAGSTLMILQWTNGIPAEWGHRQEAYFGNRKMLLCPDRDMVLQETDRFNSENDYWAGTYFFIASVGDISPTSSPYSSRGFFGHIVGGGDMNDEVDGGQFIPHRDFAGTTVSHGVDPNMGNISWLQNGVEYPSPSEQPATIEPNEPDNGVPTSEDGLYYTTGGHPNLHARRSHEDGANIGFVDGHAEYRLDENTTRVIDMYQSHNNAQY